MRDAEVVGAGDQFAGEINGMASKSVSRNPSQKLGDAQLKAERRADDARIKLKKEKVSM